MPTTNGKRASDAAQSPKSNRYSSDSLGEHVQSAPKSDVLIGSLQSKTNPAVVSMMHKVHGVLEQVAARLRCKAEDETIPATDITLYLDQENCTVYIQHHTFPSATPLTVPLPSLLPSAQDSPETETKQTARSSVPVHFTLASLWALCRTYPLLHDYIACCSALECDRIGSDRWNDVLIAYCGSTTVMPAAEPFDTRATRRVYGGGTATVDAPLNSDRGNDSPLRAGKRQRSLRNDREKYDAQESDTDATHKVRPVPHLQDGHLTDSELHTWLAFVNNTTADDSPSTDEETKHAIQPVLRVQRYYERLFQTAMETDAALTFTNPTTEETHRPIGELTRHILRRALQVTSSAHKNNKHTAHLKPPSQAIQASAGDNVQTARSTPSKQVGNQARHASHSLSVAPVAVCGGRFYILVPAAANTPVNMTNVVPFLNDLTFVAPSADTFATRKRSALIKPDRACGPMPGAEFVVLDDISLLQTPEDWCRVVACFVSGKTWQFHRWFPFATESNDGTKTVLPVTSTAQIFSSIVSFHVVYDDDRVEDHVRQWAVHGLRVSRRKSNSAYKDVLQARQVWEKILTHIRTGNVVLPLE